jgi:hypothetical protein
VRTPLYRRTSLVCDRITTFRLWHRTGTVAIGIAHRRTRFAWCAVPSKTPDSAVEDELPMPADAPQPPHPLYALTTYELKDYRRRLERAIGDKVIGSAPIASDLREKLGEVVSEQEQRQRIRNGERKGTHTL